VVCPCPGDDPIPITTPKTPMATINSFASSIHIHHHTYFKSSYIHIQVFHILHHHTMKLLLAFKSFMPRRPIVEIGNKNWFTAGYQFGSENYFAAGATISIAKTGSLQPTHFAATNATSLHPTQFQQRITISLQDTQFGSEC
jgi:hypothetical protein